MATNPINNNTKTNKTTKTGGRIGAEQYTGLSTTTLDHDYLKPGDLCPECCQGKLYASEPGVIIKLVGNPIISGEKFIINKLRCNLCGQIYAPQKYLELQQTSKYAPSSAVAIALHKYQLGAAFTRIEKAQKMLGIPLAKSTQWDLVNDLELNVEPVFSYLEYEAAQGDYFSYDGTPNKILEIPDNSNRNTTRTTAIIVKNNEHIINLFYTNTNLEGENIAALLKQRRVNTPVMTMTDASKDNFSTAIPLEILTKMIICFCLAHGRRDFHKLLDYFKVECDFVLECIGKVYANERYCKENKLTDLERLQYHQLHSEPIMQELRVWMVNKLKFPSEHVEPNNALGEAMKYMLRNWQELTKFLIVPGAPLDNNLTEQLIKFAILHRKNSLFYKTTRGARVGSVLMSLIQTANANKVNPFDYLVALHKNAELVKRFPYLWLPWNYHEQLAILQIAA